MRLIDFYYPIGAFYMTTNSNANPTEYFGGEWEELEKYQGAFVFKRIK